VTAAIERDELPPPSVDELENACAALVGEITDYRVKREAKHASGQPLEVICAAALCRTPYEVVVARSWARRPVDKALKAGIKAVGQLLFDRLGSTDALRDVVERVCDRQRRHEGLALSAVDPALDGVGRDGDRWWC
jgi:uncharacterized small protein (DUF1192 family)